VDVFFIASKISADDRDVSVLSLDMLSISQYPTAEIIIIRSGTKRAIFLGGMTIFNIL
jgi:hypothetical protein